MKIYRNAFLYIAVIFLANNCADTNIEKDVNELLNGKYANRVQELKLLHTQAVKPLAKGIDESGNIKGISITDMGLIRDSRCFPAITSKNFRTIGRSPVTSTSPLISPTQ